MQQGSNLFEVRLNEQGKKFIKKFVAISYTIIVLVFFESAMSIYWSIRTLMTRTPIEAEFSGFAPTFYDMSYPYISILISLLALVSNIYYVQFPKVLLHSVELNDESGVNKSVGLLFKGGLIFLSVLLLTTATTIWGITLR